MNDDNDAGDSDGDGDGNLNETNAANEGRVCRGGGGGAGWSKPGHTF